MEGVKEAGGGKRDWSSNPQCLRLMSAARHCPGAHRMSLEETTAWRISMEDKHGGEWAEEHRGHGNRESSVLVAEEPRIGGAGKSHSS